MRECLVELTPAARELHADAVVLDGHNDLSSKLAKDPRDLTHSQPDWHTDIPRLRAGGVDAQFWAAYVPVTEIAAQRCTRHALEQIDEIHRMIRSYPDTFQFAESDSDIELARSSGRIASLIGVEGGHAIENSLGALRMFRALGARYLTLTHSDSLEWVDAATDVSRCGGLSDFGAKVVAEMNAIGMLPDIAHVSVDAMQRVLDVSRGPVISSHSCADAVARHARNIPDDVLRRVAASGGLVMVNFSSVFVDPEAAVLLADIFDRLRQLRLEYPDPDEFEAVQNKMRAQIEIPRGTVNTVVDHIEHVIRVAGADHVGLGSDFDGVAVVPEQLDDVSCYPYITQALIDRGFECDVIVKVLGSNMLRVLRLADEVSS